MCSPSITAADHIQSCFLKSARSSCSVNSADSRKSDLKLCVRTSSMDFLR